MLHNRKPPNRTRRQEAGASAEPESVKIEYRRLLKQIEEEHPAFRGIVDVYRQEVLPAQTRTIHLLGRKCPARIIHTLLGYEVQASYKRVQCPDLPTARYLRIFMEIGCRSIRLPYDPTTTQRIVPELEESLRALQAGLERRFPSGRELRVRTMQRLCAAIREQLVRG